MQIEYLRTLISNTINNFPNDAPEETNDNTPSSCSSNAFSYNATMSPPMEPSTNKNEPSSHGLPTPYPRPMVTTSSQIPPSSIAHDPIIQQLQSSLQMMATHINTIQETTQNHFSDMQLQHQHIQQSLQNILKQGLLDMNQHRHEKRQMM
jgi:hypothetical protein